MVCEKQTEFSHKSRLTHVHDTMNRLYANARNEDSFSCRLTRVSFRAPTIQLPRGRRRALASDPRPMPLRACSWRERGNAQPFRLVTSRQQLAGASARDSAAATASHKRPKVKSCRGFSWTKSSPALERNRFAVPEQKSSQISVVLFCRLDVNWLQRRTPRQGLLNAVGRQVPASLKNRTALRELHSLGWRVYLGVRPKFG